jgi:hypothetical protein
MQEEESTRSRSAQATMLLPWEIIISAALEKFFSVAEIRPEPISLLLSFFISCLLCAEPGAALPGFPCPGFPCPGFTIPPNNGNHEIMGCLPLARSFL